MLKKIEIRNYRVFRRFTLEFKSGMNVLVGDNDVGKSTLLEAINLALTGRVQNRLLSVELSPYAFNLEVAQEYIDALKTGDNAEPPEFTVDLYLDDAADTALLRGTNNVTNQDACGLRFRGFYNAEFADEYKEFIKKPDEIRVIPTEYYRCEWLGFSGNPVTARSVPASASLIDASSIRLQSGADYYLQAIINTHLTMNERVELTRSYRSLRERFAGMQQVERINERLGSTSGDVTTRAFSLGIDISQRTTWESSLVPHLDDLPFGLIGKGEQSSLKILLAINRKVDDAHVILIEEPENHLSFSSMNMLIEKIRDKCDGKQVIATTHSSYVLNKLGVGQVVLLSASEGRRLTTLSDGTQRFFQKLPGYDTLRLVLAKMAILVEGPSDELVVQRAYRDTHNGKLPIEDGIDVISVRALAFARFLELAVLLGRKTTVITDNDGEDPAEVAKRYEAFTGHEFIKIEVGDDPDLHTLEPHLLAANGLDALNRIFGKKYTNKDDLLKYMERNKADCALAIFETEHEVEMPRYIRDAVA